MMQIQPNPVVTGVPYTPHFCCYPITWEGEGPLAGRDRQSRNVVDDQSGEEAGDGARTV